MGGTPGAMAGASSRARCPWPCNRDEERRMDAAAQRRARFTLGKGKGERMGAAMAARGAGKP